jgi:hypothetical protein
MTLIIRAALVGAILLALFVGVSGCSFHDVKIDPNIYSGINENGNPIDADPHDETWFHFKVTYDIVETETDEYGVPIGVPPLVTSLPIGDYDANVKNTAHFPETYGPPDSKGPEKTCLIGPFLCTYKVTDYHYHIDHENIPEGYCPLDPQGHDIHKSEGGTVNMKFYKGGGCGFTYTPAPWAYKAPQDNDAACGIRYVNQSGHLIQIPGRSCIRLE